MDFKTASILGSLLSKDYAEEFLRLLATYKDISASEAASRLGIHIKTAQDFLDGLHSLGVTSKTEVYESKRPYYRYSLKKNRIVLELDLEALTEVGGASLEDKIRERKESGAIFKASARGDFISVIHYFSGSGRDRSERRLNLTKNQGKFLFHLPFPTEPRAAVRDLIHKAGIEESYTAEILDMVDLLVRLSIIEREGAI
jgi:predicted transcriptional regulator